MRPRTLLIALVAVVLVAAAGIVVVLQPDEAVAQKQGFVVSFAAAEVGDDRVDQIRDWARIGLAAHLGMDTERLRDAFYDAFPIRDKGFADLARQPTGPGRALADGNTLHLLIPRDDVNDERTAGLLLDQHRTDAGKDPERVQLHRYEINNLSMTITDEDAKNTNDFRAQNGYVTARVDENLDEFLSTAKHLSTLEIRNGEVWAGGWNWPGPQVTADDISVLQRAYAKREQPGFSLDPPQNDPTRADVEAVLQNVQPETVARLLAGQADEQLIQAGVFDRATPEELKAAGLPTDRADLWAMLNLLQGRPLYQEARYDGGIQGTEVAMTLFYTDLIAKQWLDGVGDGVPTVSGFVPDSRAPTPPSHCATGASAETGRLWFGQNDKAFSFTDDRTSIGAQSTRLFSRSDGATGEVEPTYAVARGLKWWDEHYQAVADHEAQYARLDQIMRWSGALEWLHSKGKQLPETAPRTDLTFASWYQSRDDLKERGDIRPVRPPSAKREAVLTKPSPAFSDCGFRQVRGGVSLGDRITRVGDDFQADLPEPVRRAGPKDPGSTTGKITDVTVELTPQGERKVVDRVERTISTTNGTAQVHTAATGREVIPLGELKVMQPATSLRQLATTLEAGRNRIDYRVDYQGNHLGTLVAEKTRSFISLSWVTGPVHRMIRALHPLQRGKNLNDNVFYSLRDANGQLKHRIGGKDEPWLSIGQDGPAEGFAVRVGVQNPDGLTNHLLAELEPRGPPLTGSYLTLTATPDGPPQAQFSNTQPTGTKFQVHTPDDSTTSLYVDQNKVTVAAVDPVLGHNGTAEGAAMLRDIADVLARPGETDGLLRAVRFGDVGAMIGQREIFLAPQGHQWSTRVLEALNGDAGATMRITDGKAIHVDKSPLHRVSTQKLGLGEVLNSPGTVFYVNESFVATLPTKDGPVAADALNQDITVTVREVTKENQLPADVQVHRGAEWMRVDTAPRIGTPGSTGLDIVITLQPSATPAKPAGPVPRFVLICPENDDANGCGD